MNRSFNAMGWSALAFLLAATAQAAGPNASCSFGGCSASITPSVFQLTCDGKTAYSGTYELNTDFKTTQIAATSADGPKIIVQGLPSTSTQVSATLVMPGQSIAGNCSMRSK